MTAAQRSAAARVQHATPESPGSEVPVAEDVLVTGGSGYDACIGPLLAALGWRGDARAIAEARPHFVAVLDIIDFRNTLANIGYMSRPVRIAVNRIDTHMLPCLFVPGHGAPMIVQHGPHGRMEVFDSGTGETKPASAEMGRGTAYVFETRESEKGDPRSRHGERTWFQRTAARFGPTLRILLVVTFLLNVLALTVPLFIMLIYDRVVATGSLSSLVYLGAGIGVALAFEFALRYLRARMLAYVGARADTLAGTAVFQRILYLPAAMTEAASVGAQVARMREFEAVRDFFTSPLALVFLEVPFVLLFIAVIAALGGSIAWVPVALFAFFALAAVILNPLVRKSVAASSRAAGARQDFQVEMLSKLRTIKYSRADETWFDRYREHSAEAATAHFRTATITALVQTVGHVLMMCAGIATLAFGVGQVLDGDMTVGALIACMALVWRVLSPMHTCFLTFIRLEQVRNGIRQINNLMALPPESEQLATKAPNIDLEGRVTFSRVSFRYTQDAHPAVIGISFDIRPGEVIAVVGPNGSGKSSLLNLILGLYTPQVGSVRIDGHDIRQLDPVQFRKSVAYMPQDCHLFHGTIAQNLRLADPGASDEELQRAAAGANVLEDILALPQGFETRVADQAVQNMSAGFRQRLALARVYLKNAPLVLMDEPSTALDPKGDDAFRLKIENLRGRNTVFFVTHRPSHMKLADRVLVLDGGALTLSGTPEEVLNRIRGDLL